MKHRSSLVFFIIFIFLFTSCGDIKANTPQIQTGSYSVTAQVFQEYYSGMGVMGSSSSMAYTLDITITNTSKETLTISSINTWFLSTSNQGMQATTTNVNGGPLEVLAPGQSFTLPMMTTNGYTYDLFAQADGHALGVLIEVVSDSNQENYLSTLPELTTLPIYYIDNVGTPINFVFLSSTN
jgi:hypothetical protein